MKKVVVTGASRGIGRAIAVRLATEGYEVHGTYNTAREQADELAGQHDITFYQSDLTKRQDTLRLADKLSWLGVHALINNAAVWEQDRVDAMDLSSWDRTLEANFTAPMILATTLAKTMIRGSSIVNISSTDGLSGAYDLMGYSASKAALQSMTKSLANTLGPNGIRVNAIAPGWVDTTTGEVPEVPSPAIPVGRCAKPDEIAAAVRFLISDEASYFNGAILVIDGGLLNADPIAQKESGY